MQCQRCKKEILPSDLGHGRTDQGEPLCGPCSFLYNVAKQSGVRLSAPNLDDLLKAKESFEGSLKGRAPEPPTGGGGGVPLFDVMRGQIEQVHSVLLTIQNEFIKEMLRTMGAQVDDVVLVIRNEGLGFRLSLDRKKTDEKDVVGRDLRARLAYASPVFAAIERAAINLDEIGDEETAMDDLRRIVAIWREQNHRWENGDHA